MKAIYKIVAILCCCAMSFSCSDFLEEEVYDFYAPQNVYKTAKDAENAIVGVYEPLLSTRLFGENMFKYIDLDHDHICCETWIGKALSEGVWDQLNETNAIWEYFYKIVERANEVIAKVPPIEMDETRKNHILGEAYFLRAFSYFYMVRMWGALPIRTQNFDPSSYNYSTPRSSIKDVYETVIIPDLKQAELLMQFKGSELNLPVGRATKGAAKALLSKVYLHIASASMPDASVYVKCGYQSNANSFRTSQVGNNVEVFTKDVVKGYEAFDSNSYFQLAMEKSKELIAIEGSVSGYKLKNTFMNTFQNLQTDDEEVIFVLGTANDPNFMSRYLDYYSYKSGDIAYSKWIGRGYIFVSNAFYNSYKEEEYGSIDDQRIKDGFSHLYRKYDNTGNYTWRVYPDTERDIYQEQVPNETLLDENDSGFTTKYDWFNGSSADKYTDATLPFLRYADVLLMYAEAMNEVHGPTFVDEFGKSTIDYVNVVRGRSDAKLVSFDTEYAMNASKLSERIGMRSFILAERGRELYQELNRAFDLKRWGVYLQVMNKVNAVRNIGKARQERNLLYPLPKSEMDANMYIESNNPGW